MFYRRSEFTEGWGLTPPCLEPWARTEVSARAFSRRPERAARFLGASGAPARKKTYRSITHHPPTRASPGFLSPTEVTSNHVTNPHREPTETSPAWRIK